MNLRHYKNKVTIDSLGVDSFQNNIIEILIKNLKSNGINAHLKSENVVVFNNEMNVTTHTGRNRLQIFKLLRKGYVKFSKVERGMIVIEYSTSLEHVFNIVTAFSTVYFLYGFFIGGFSFIMIVINIVWMSIMIYLVFFLANKLKLDALINRTVDKSTYSCP